MPREDMQSSDEELMSLCAQGDKAAFNTLVRKYQFELLNFFSRMGDYKGAEDLTQETFLRLYRYRNRYKPSAKLKTFLYLLARRAWIDHCRASGRRRERYEEYRREQELHAPSAEPLLEEARARVEAALNELSEEMRMVVVLSVYQGFKYREIAEMLEIPLGTVKTRMHNALKRLRRLLEDEQARDENR